MSAMKWLRLCVQDRKGALVLLLALSQLASGATHHVAIATGQRDGNYYRFTNAVAAVSAGSGITIDLVNSGGSVENVQLLTSGRVDFALVQSDIAVRAARGHQPFVDPIPNVRLVLPLFTEAVHVLVRSDLFVFTVGDLKGKIVSVGPEGSGTEVTARAVLEASGAALEEIQVRHSEMNQIAVDLAHDSIDAAFITSTAPVNAVTQATRDQSARLLILDPKVIERLTGTGSYVEISIPKGTYPGQQEVSTVGTQAILVTRTDVDPAEVSAVLDLIVGHRREIERLSGVRLDLLSTGVGWNSPIEMHPAYMRYLSVGHHSWWRWALEILAGVLFISMLLLVYTKLQKYLAGYAVPLLASVALLALWQLGAAGLYWFEHGVNENFATFGKSAWSVLVYVSGGFQARTPLTKGGERVAVFTIILGVSVVAWFVAEMGKHLVSEELSALLTGKHMVPKKISAHIVIINWNYRAEAMIEQLHGPDFEHKKAIVVISQGDVQFPARPSFGHCYWVKGDAADRRVLEQAGVSDSHSIVILSLWHEPELQGGSLSVLDPSDAKTLLVLLLIRSICGEKGSQHQVPITAEIRSARNLDVARIAGKGGPTEYICAENFGAQVMTQCAVTPGLAALYQELLTFEPGADEIYKVKMPGELVGRQFSDILRFYAKRELKADAVIPIALGRDSKVYLNPCDDIGPVRKDDYLFVICDNQESVTRRSRAVGASS